MKSKYRCFSYFPYGCIHIAMIYIVVFFDIVLLWRCVDVLAVFDVVMHYASFLSSVRQMCCVDGTKINENQVKAVCSRGGCVNGIKISVFFIFFLSIVHT